MTILRGLLLFAFFYSLSVSFSAEPLELSAQSASTGTALVSLPQQLKEDLREVEAICWMRFSLNNALLSSSENEGYLSGVKNDMAFYVKANKILKLINLNSSEIPSSIDKLNRSSINRLYQEVSKYVQARTDQKRMERIAYKDLLKERGGGPLMNSFAEIVNELPPLRQIKDILGRYASKHEVEMTRFFESDVTCTFVKVNGTKIINELENVTESFFSLLGFYNFSEFEGYKSSTKLERSKPLISLKDRLAFEKAHSNFSPGGEVTLPKTPPLQESKKDRLAFEKAHPNFSPGGEVTLPKTPPLQESKADALVKIVKLLCAVKDFMNDATIGKILENKKTVFEIIQAEEVQQDVLSILREKIANLTETIGRIKFGDSSLDTQVQKYLTQKLEFIEYISNGFLTLTKIKILSLTDKISRKIETLKQERKESELSQESALNEATGEKEVALTLSPKATAMSKAEAPVKPKELAEEEIGGALPPSAVEAEVKQRRVSSKTKGKKAKDVLQPLGYQEESAMESETARKKKLLDMVQGLRESWKSLKFRDLKRAVGQLGGTLEPNGRDSHYTIRLRHVETGHPILGATLNKKATSGEYPWWLDTAVDTLERAVGLVTDDMSRIYEKVHKS